MKKLKNTKGLTLIEVIVSIAILGIIATAFLNLFGNSFVSIASFGGKSEAVLGASDILEQVYSWQSQQEEKPEEEKIKNKEGYESKLEEFLSSETMGGVKKDDVEVIGDSVSEDKSFNYHFEDATLNGLNLTIAVPNGKKGDIEELISFIPMIDLDGGI